MSFDQSPAYVIRPVGEQDRSWMACLLEEHWGSAVVVTRGVLHQADQLPGFIAAIDNLPVGLVTYHLAGKSCELVSLNSEVEGRGIGSALVAAVLRAASDQGCDRVWLITTNDNLPALRFYQKRGFLLSALYPNALEYSRKLKPEISMTGLDGIPIRDEIELEILL